MDVLLDLDGTLIDPGAGLIASVQYALDRLGRPVPPAADLIGMIGPPLRTSFPKLLGGTHATEAAIAHYREHYYNRGMYDAVVYAGIPEALERLRAAGCRLLLATAKPHHFARPILEHFALASHFAAIHGPELDGTRDAKAELLAHIVAEHNLEVATAIMVGDRALDVHAANANGIASIGAAWGYGGRAELQAAGATAICATPDALAALVAAVAGRGRCGPPPARRAVQLSHRRVRAATRRARPPPYS
jgi:phosphoglycolate phosphatase